MPVYVDDARFSFARKRRPIIMCHMIADTAEELDAMAEAIKLSERWLQYAAERKEHYDIAQGKRKLAVKAGAIEISSRELVHKLMVRDMGVYLGVKNENKPQTKVTSGQVVPIHTKLRDEHQGDVRSSEARDEAGAANQGA